MKLYYPEIESSTALPQFILLKMPPFIAGCLEGMLLVTLVGTTAGTLYANSTICYRGLLRNKVKNETLATRILILIFTLIVSLIVLLNKGDLILNWTFMGAGLRGAVSLFPLMLTLFIKRTIKKEFVFSSMLAAPIFTLIGKLLLPQIDILPVFWGILGSLIFIVAGLIFS